MMKKYLDPDNLAMLIDAVNKKHESYNGTSYTIQYRIDKKMQQVQIRINYHDISMSKAFGFSEINTYNCVLFKKVLSITLNHIETEVGFANTRK